MYYNPLKVIASVQGSGNATSVPPIVSDQIPEQNSVGGDLMPGDFWWDPVNEYLYLLIDQNDENVWVPVGGKGYLVELINDLCL